jgi:hypothetical protein
MTLYQFQNRFFSQSMKQSFNEMVSHFESDENESALHKWIRFNGMLT